MQLSKNNSIFEKSQFIFGLRLMEHSYLLYRNSRISYYQGGLGDDVLICFHGYSEQGSAFSFLEKYAAEGFFFISIDLPYHGKTEWREGLNFSTEDLVKILEAILQQNDKQQAKMFTILGFSLGGRIALSLFQCQPEQVKKVVLLAPDGLKINFWYWLATQTWLGNKLFSFTMKRPGWFFSLLKLLNSVNLVNASIFKFVNFYIGNKTARELLYNRWTGLRKIKPSLNDIKKEIKEKNTPFRIVYGKHDRIILSSVGETFKKGIEDQCKISLIDAGHQVLHEKHAEEIVAALLH